jgi:soluble lytic murein transglycosylase
MAAEGYFFHSPQSRLPAPSRFPILGLVNLMRLLSAAKPEFPGGRILQLTTRFRYRGCATLLMLCFAGTAPAQEPAAADREIFTRAWQAAASGERPVFEQLMPGLGDYLLFPYLRYEDLRYRRARVDPGEMAGFLADHEDWAFSPALRTAWLRTLGDTRQWDEVLTHGGDSKDVEVRCHHAHARIRAGDTVGLLPVAQALWTVGKSQPDACDPVFAWLRQQDGITPGLAWERIRLAMEARQPRLTLYLARFLPEQERVWADRWYQQDRGGYRQLRQAAAWPDQAKNRDIADYGLRRLARSDPDRAWGIFQALDGGFAWPADTRSGILREIALWSAVDGSVATPERMHAVPEEARDDRLLEWWIRRDLAGGRWQEVIETTGALSAESAGDSRWRYWRARALLETGARAQAEELLAELALEASYFGFLAADLLRLPYTICPETPSVESAEVDRLAARPGFERALELRRAGIVNWARSEWQSAARSLDPQGLRTAAALAVREDWPEQAIFALGNSGDLRWYEWRFPLAYHELVAANASSRQLDPSWVMGLMRSESAMAEDAISGAGARGLLQVTPDTARQLARRHAYRFTGPQQLLQAEDNIVFGTTYLRDLLDRFGNSEVLASGAYNAGPNAVDRWLNERPSGEPAIWVENLPYFETRDYIPRVLAFTTLYDWRLQRPVSRISSRMPAFDSRAAGVNMQRGETVEVVCRAPG